MKWEEAEKQVTDTMDSMKKTIESLSSKVEGSEKLLQQHKTEMGQARKEIEDFYKKFKDNVGDPESFKKDIDSLKAKVDNIGTKSGTEDEKGGVKGGTNNPQEDLEKVMTDEQKKKADEVFKKLAPEQRLLIKSDPKKKKAFMEAAIQANPAIPDSLFSTPGGTEGDDDPEGFKALFGMASRQKNFVPGGKHAAATGFANVSGNEQPKQRILIGGKIPRPAPAAQPT